MFPSMWRRRHSMLRVRANRCHFFLRAFLGEFVLLLCKLSGFVSIFSCESDAGVYSRMPIVRCAKPFEVTSKVEVSDVPLEI